MHKLVRGAIAGTVATVPMTLVMISLFRRLPRRQRYPLPPRLLMENLTARVTRDKAVDEAKLTHVTVGTHFGYGAITGAFYPYLERDARPNVLTGMTFGVGIWAASYLGWIPAAGLLAPATRHPASRNALMLAAHLVWGAALARISAALRDRKNAGGRIRAAQHRYSSEWNRVRQGELPFSRRMDFASSHPLRSPSVSLSERV